MTSDNDPHREEMMEGVVDAVLRGDTEDFQVFNEEYERAQGDGVEIGRRGKKARIRFGDGSAAGPHDTEMVCPDCGGLLRFRGFRFVEISRSDDEAMMLHGHRLDPWGKQETPCPAWKWRARVHRAFADNRLWRRFFAAGLGFAWRNLDWNHPIEGPIYRALRWKEHLGWRIIWRLMAMVGYFEQRAWGRRG